MIEFKKYIDYLNEALDLINKGYVEDKTPEELAVLLEKRDKEIVQKLKTG